jgi:hypothetical protein
MRDSYWNDISEAFGEISIYDGASVLAKDLKKFPSHIGDLLAAHWFLSEMQNGGIAQFFLNSSGILAPEAADGFARMGLSPISDTLRKSMSRLGVEYPRDKAARQLALCTLADVEDPSDACSSNVFTEEEEAIYAFGDGDVRRIYDRMDSYAFEKRG